MSSAPSRGGRPAGTDLSPAPLDLARLIESLYDVSPGGCGSDSFNLSRLQYSLIRQFESAVGLYCRQQLRLT